MIDIKDLDNNLNEPQKTKNYVRKCEYCGSDQDIYVCEEHAKNFCKSCLSETIKHPHCVLFKAKCYKAECTFYPLIQRTR